MFGAAVCGGNYKNKTNKLYLFVVCGHISNNLKHEDNLHKLRLREVSLSHK